jgi:hypothetical protein
LQEDIMQSNLERGKAASDARSAGRFVAILARVPFIATLALCAPDRALAACGVSHPAGVHAGGYWLEMRRLATVPAVSPSRRAQPF